MEGQSKESQQPTVISGTVSSSNIELDKAIVSPFMDFVNDISATLHDLVSNFVAGRLANYIDYWHGLTHDREVLNTIRGLSIEFKCFPEQLCKPNEYAYSEQELGYLDSEIEKLLDKGVIVKAQDVKGQYVSNIFLREKKDGTYRMILNLKGLNKMVEYHKFKMDTLISAISLITPDCYMASVDYKDAYYSVSIRKEHRKYLRFCFRNVLYEFTCLPNGLTSGPRLFTKITKPLFSTLRERGHLNSPYIDDVLLVGDTWRECALNVRDTVEISLDAGFVVHPAKSIFVPTKRIEFLGFWLDSAKMTVTLTERKALTIKQLCKELKQYKKPTIRTVAKLVGKLVSSFPAVLYGKLFYRQLDNEKTQALRLSAGNFEAKMKLSALAKDDLSWWEDNVLQSFSPMVHEKPTLTVFSDASLSGWGAVRGEIKTGGNWSLIERKIHINVLELMAALYALSSLCADCTETHIRMMIDNKTAVSYINGMGGRTTLCNKIARQIWMWCKERNVWVSAAYLTSKENEIADKMSRISHNNSEWSLSNEIFQKLVENFGQPSIDMFATRLNYKCERYVAWQPDPYSVAVDAFSLDWASEKLVYIFPPFCIIHKVLQKIDFDGADAIVIVPLWTTQPWWGKLIRLLTTCPLYFHRNRYNLQHPNRDADELPRMQLLICSLSGKPSRQMRYQQTPRKSYCLHGDNPPQDNIRSMLHGGRNLQLDGKSVYLHPL